MKENDLDFEKGRCVVCGKPTVNVLFPNAKTKTYVCSDECKMKLIEPLFKKSSPQLTAGPDDKWKNIENYLLAIVILLAILVFVIIGYILWLWLPHP